MALKGPTQNYSEIRSWADGHAIVPVELRPHRLDSEPASMALLVRSTAEGTARVTIIAWDDFFMKFDELKLTLVYDDGTAYNEILKIETQATTIPPAYRTTAAD